MQEQPSGFLKWSIPGWNNELEFSQWLNGVKDDLVEESYDQYQYVGFEAEWTLSELIWTIYLS